MANALGFGNLKQKYILDNGNDGHIIEKGHYNEQGLKDGVWTERTPYNANKLHLQRWRGD